MPQRMPQALKPAVDHETTPRHTRKRFSAGVSGSLSGLMAPVLSGDVIRYTRRISALFYARRYYAVGSG
jgi:hypothetical protein